MVRAAESEVHGQSRAALRRSVTEMM